MTTDAPTAGSLAAPKAVVLLSGGLDSATTLAIARQQGFTCFALSFRYGQRHQLELERAGEIAKRLGAERHRIVDIDLAQFGGSALTTELPVPHHRSVEQMPAEIPVTYVPARNTVFLSLALAWSEVLEATDIFIGVNAVDYSGYPDCRPEFIAAYEQMARLATRVGVSGGQLRIQTPLIDRRKSEIIRTALDLGVPLERTISCYDPDRQGRACGQCDACLLRLRGFAELGQVDPAVYQSGSGPQGRGEVAETAD